MFEWKFEIEFLVKLYFYYLTKTRNMRVILEVVSGPHAGKKIELEEGQTVRVGRTDKADFPTRDTYMSGLHFAVECVAGVGRVKDLGSRNGTLLNGDDLSAAVLNDGDEIFAGQTNFVVRLQKSAPPSSSPARTTVPQQATTVPDVLPLRTNAEQPPPPEEDSTREPSPKPARVNVNAPVQTPPPPPASPRAAFQESPPLRSLPTDRGGRGGMARSDHVSASPRSDAVERSPETVGLTPEGRVQKILETVAASTPKGRLLQILREQPAPLYALLDAVHDPQVLELLHGAREELQPLYEGGQHAPEKIPYLVRLPAQSRLTEAFVNQGWGKNWGVYLTCAAPLAELRGYFRQSLMVKTQDGREFFFRFYEPRFLRDILRSSSHADSAKFFGPAGSYLIEAEKPEILLQCTRTRQGVEIRERLLLLPGT